MISSIPSPFVKRVPVLSKTTAPTLLILLKALLFFINKEFYKAIFIVITSTVGIANPKAQGHEITKIEMALSKGKHI